MRVLSRDVGCYPDLHLEDKVSFEDRRDVMVLDEDDIMLQNIFLWVHWLRLGLGVARRGPSG